MSPQTFGLCYFHSWVSSRSLIGKRCAISTSWSATKLGSSEVKSIRAGKANIGDAFARIDNGQAFLYNADIQPYEQASHEIPAAKRVRRLLLHRHEIDKLYEEANVAGRALVILSLYWKNGKLKAEIGIGQGKVARDKRADLKKRATDRETAREVAKFNRKHAG
jgi:SsrA-binding protein